HQQSRAAKCSSFNKGMRVSICSWPCTLRIRCRVLDELPRRKGLAISQVVRGRSEVVTVLVQSGSAGGPGSPVSTAPPQRLPWPPWMERSPAGEYHNQADGRLCDNPA